MNIAAGVLHEDTLAPYLINLSRLRTTNINISNKNKWLHTKKAKSRKYPVETVNDADYTDDLTLLVNTPAQAESQLNSPRQASSGIGLYSDKTDYMCFNQDDAIFSINGNTSV